MLKRILSGLLILSMILSLNSFIVSAAGESGSKRRMEYLTRGAIGANINGNIYLSWRLLGTEPMDTTFNIYRDNEKIVSNLNNTNYTDIGGNVYGSYQIAAVINGVEQSRSSNITILQGRRDQLYKDSPYAYFDIPISAPSPKNCSSYSANDASVGDLDSDGEYEIILKWDPDNSRDNSNSGVTGNVYIDAYKTNGTRLWRIDLGRNIRAGAHYNPYIVYDFDGDGKAEIAVKTAPGSIDGQGNFVTNAGINDEIKNADNSAVYVNSKGFILDGPEYLTIFDGLTGQAVQTVFYTPNRTDANYWGDRTASQGNRVDRYLAGVAYLDGVHPSLLMCRGYYNRSAVTAYNWDGTNLTQLWTCDSNDSKNNKFYGQGNHQLSIADVDNDGKDEIIYGSAIVDDDGSVAQSMYGNDGKRWGHGDALHVSDFDGDGEQEIFSVLEDSPHWGTAFRKGGKNITDPIWKQTATDDTGRGIMTNVSAELGAIGWSSQGAGSDDNGNIYYYGWDTEGKQINFKGNSNGCAPNFAIYWDGDLLRELADGDRIIKWSDYKYEDGMYAGFDRLWTASNSNPVATNNYTKKNPCLQADLFGDWREEIVYRLADNSALRVFTSLIPTDYKLTTFMHDSQYRCAVAWQNVGYNQPPHPSYYIGPDKETYTKPDIEPVIRNMVSFTVTADDNTPIENAQIKIDDSIPIVTDSLGKANTPILAGKHTYSIKCIGYEAVPETEFIVKESDNITEIALNMTVKENCGITISYLTTDGKTLKASEKLPPAPILSEYNLTDDYKEDIKDDKGVTYEYNPNLSSDTHFKSLTDDINIKLVFNEKTLPGKKGTEFYRTNFSKDGFSANSQTHGYSTAAIPSYNVIKGIKTADYSIGSDSITIDIGEGSSEFVAEFDMGITATEATIGGDLIGVNLNSGNVVGPTIGMRFTGAKAPQVAIYRGKGSTQTDSLNSVTPGKIYRYVIECDGTAVYLTVGDPETGEVILEKKKLDSLRNLDLTKHKINKFVINRINGTGTSTVSFADFRIYKVGGPNKISWREDSDILADIPSETSLAPKEVSFITGINNYRIPVSSNFNYKLKNSDGTDISTTSSSISIDENGIFKVKEDSPKGNYKVICEYDGETAKEYNITVIKNGKIEIYNAANDTSGTGILKYTGDDKASLKFSNKEYSFSQDSTGGREFLGDFYPCDSGEAEINLTFSTGGVKDSAGNWNWTDVENREYEYEIQFLDPEYNGENPEDHIVFSLSQKYGAKAQEVQYAAKNSEKTYVKNNDNLIGTIDKNGITSRSTTTWNISVKFNFDKNTVSFKLLNSDNSGGYVYENIPTYGGFKTLRFVSKGNNKVQWTPKISNLVYSKFAFEPSPVDPKTIKVDGKGALSVSFDKPYDGGAPTSYKVTLTDTDGKVLHEKTSDTVPVVFDEAVSGKYIVKISSSNLKGETEEVTAGPFDIEVIPSPVIPIEITVQEDSVADGKLSFKTIVTNNTDTINGVIFGALYDEKDVLLDSHYTAKELIKGDNYSDFTLNTKGKNNLKLKVFVWDSTEGMKPLYETPAFEQSYKNNQPL